MDLMGGVDSRGGYISKILYVKMKESGLLGVHVLGMPPRSTNEKGVCHHTLYASQLVLMSLLSSLVSL